MAGFVVTDRRGGGGGEEYFVKGGALGAKTRDFRHVCSCFIHTDISIVLLMTHV